MKLSSSLPVVVFLWGSSSVVAAIANKNETRTAGLRATARSKPHPDATVEKRRLGGTPVFNNIGYAVKGYDIIKGEPLDTSGLTTVDPGFRQPIFGHDVKDYGLILDQQYLVPSGISAVECEGCNMAFSTTVMDSMEMFQSAMESRVEAGGTLASPTVRGSFSASAAIKEAEERMTTKHETGTNSEISCCVYQAELEAFNMPPHTQGFLNAVKQMHAAANHEECGGPRRLGAMDSYNVVNMGDLYGSHDIPTPAPSGPSEEYPGGCSDKKKAKKAGECSALDPIFAKFVKEFGTHYVKKVTMGSIYGEQSFLSTEAIHEMQESHVNVEMAASFSAEVRLHDGSSTGCNTGCNSRTSPGLASPSGSSTVWGSSTTPGSGTTTRTTPGSGTTTRTTTTPDSTTTDSTTTTDSATTTEATCAGTLEWNDEFDGTSLDTNKWGYSEGNGCDLGVNMCGWGNQELQSYTTGDENINVCNGSLKIKTIQRTIVTSDRTTQYTSARINTHGKTDFDLTRSLRFEARIKVPHNSRGLWPAFWMLPSTLEITEWPRGGELDIMEFRGNETHLVHGTVHYGHAFDVKGQKTVGSRLEGHVGDDFHVFSVEKTPNKITWFIDGRQYAEVTSDSIEEQFNWPFENQFYIILNMAVGSWSGAVDGGTQFPNQMEVDYVRVYDISSCVQAGAQNEPGEHRELVSGGVHAESSYTYDERKTSKFSDSVSKRAVYSRGAKPPADGNVGQWLRESSDNPVPTYLELESIDSLDIFLKTSPFLRDCLTSYLDDYCEKINPGKCGVSATVATISETASVRKYSMDSESKDIEREPSITEMEKGEYTSGGVNGVRWTDTSGREVFVGVHSELFDEENMMFKSARASFSEGIGREAQDPYSEGDDFSEYGKSFIKVCPSNSAITRIETRWGWRWEDRVYRIQCSEFSGTKISEFGWKKGMDGWEDGNVGVHKRFQLTQKDSSDKIDFQCPRNHVLIGIKSDTNSTLLNLRSREWSFRCGMLHPAYVPNKESLTPIWNDVEDSFVYSTDLRSVLTGIHGDFNRSNHDTRFAFVERGLPTDIKSTGSTWSGPGWLTERTMKFECDPGTAVVGILSKFKRNQNEDVSREYKVECRAIEKHNLIHASGMVAKDGVASEAGDWSPVWKGAGAAFGLVCPNDQVLAGVQTQWDATVKDRAWKIMCLEASRIGGEEGEE